MSDSPSRRRVRPRRERTVDLSPRPVGFGPEVKEFKSLYFGRASAEKEIQQDAERFRLTYLDRDTIVAQVESQERFLILGPKGAGKSAAANYVAETWRATLGHEAVFVTNVDFDELNRTQTPLESLDRSLVSTDVNTMTDTAWRLFVCVRLLESLMRDAACDVNTDLRAQNLYAELQRVGLASDDYPKVLRSVREKKAGFHFKILHGEISSAKTDTLSPGQVADALQNLIANADTPNRHLLSIDGLDKAILANESYWQTVGALIRTVDQIRLSINRASSHSVFVLVMCRSDVFRRVRLADGPKIVADSGLYIGWNAEAADVGDVALWDYLCKKAGVSREELWGYLPKSVKVGPRGGVETRRYLLEFTRYTPRDMSLLFGKLQEQATEGVKLTGPDVRKAADRFASQHLLAEVVAESIGLLPNEVVDRLESILNSIERRVITRVELKKIVTDQGIEATMSETQLGEYLFLQGAIANYNPSSGYVQFFHRRDAAKFKPAGPWIIHTGLLYALNISWSGI